jgi:hypothetical protein
MFCAYFGDQFLGEEEGLSTTVVEKYNIVHLYEPLVIRR